jgi:two-component system, NarL family, nitrate/nitrite response regulator NarL
MILERKYQVAICDQQPIAAEGIRSLLAQRDDIEFTEAVDTLEAAFRLASGQGASGGSKTAVPDVILVDKSFGSQALMDWLTECRIHHLAPAMVVWGVALNESEALRFLQCGARGILRKSVDMASILSCIRTVAEGKTWMQEQVFRDFVRNERRARSELTSREQQVLELVEQGFKNKEIAVHLGIQPGTVKIHLKHIFEKTGVRGRYGLALNGLRRSSTTSLGSSAVGSAVVSSIGGASIGLGAGAALSLTA